MLWLQVASYSFSVVSALRLRKVVGAEHVWAEAGLL